MADVLKIALDYIAFGWAVVPIPFKTKRPVIEKWQELRITKSGATQHFNSAPQNIGVLMGAPSAGLTDVDLDCPEAVAAAPFFLTPTHFFGRPSKRCSHWPYITDLAEIDARATLKFMGAQKPERVILEIRTGGGGQGAQTVFPGSVHPSGEPITWEGNPPSAKNPIPKVDGADLKQRAAKIAACALLAQNYPKAGGRHEGAIVVTGFLCRCGFPAPAIKIFIEALAAATCQPPDKRKDMIKTAGDMAAGSAAGKHTYGFKKLEETFGKPVAQKCSEWLGYKAEFRPDGVDGDNKAPDFIRNRGGGILKTHPDNSRLAIEGLRVTLRLNEFTGAVEISGLQKFDGEIDDYAENRLRFAVGETFDFLPSEHLFHQVINDEACANRYHPVRDYLDSLEWDGTPRIDNWLRDYGGAEDTAFNRAVGRTWLIAGVRRPRQPGVKFDTLLVLESPVKGKNKSQAIVAIATRQEWFTDCLPVGADPKEVIEQLSGAWIVEYPELSGMQTREREKVMASLSRQVDKARAAYGRRPQTVPRQSIGVASTNKTDWLGEEDRRYWPVRIKFFDLERLRRDVEQLWAEAAHYEAQGEPITLPEDLWPDAAAVRACRIRENPLVPVLQDWLDSLGNPNTVQTEPIWEALGETVTTPSGTTARRPIPVERRPRLRTTMGDAMSELGYEPVQDRTRTDQRGKRYYQKIAP